MTDTKYTIKIDREVMRIIKDEAYKDNITINDIIVSILTGWAEARKEEGK